MCDTLALVGLDRARFAKNSDRPRNEPQVLETLPCRAAGGRLRTTHLVLDDAGAHAALVSRPTWMWGVEHGVNEHRVAIGNERVYTVDDASSAPPGLTGMDLVRLGLERADTAEQAVAVMTELLERHGQGGDCKLDGDRYYSSFLIADPTAAWVLETEGRSWAARHHDDGAAISNRLSLGRDWTRASADVPAGTRFDTRRDPHRPTGPADRRLAATEACVATGAATVDAGALVATLRHHGAGPWGRPGTDPAVWIPPPRGDGEEAWSVCLHLPALGLATTGALVADLPGDPALPARAWAVLGSPCASVFVPVFVPHDVPVLADASTWVRFARLRDRVEARPEELGRVRGVLGPVEAELWARADEAALTPATRAAWGTTVGGVLDAALGRLGV